MKISVGVVGLYVRDQDEAPPFHVETPLSPMLDAAPAQTLRIRWTATAPWTPASVIRRRTGGRESRRVEIRDEGQLLDLESGEEDALADGGCAVLAGVPHPFRARLQRRSH
jgi:hypothetical protein